MEESILKSTKKLLGVADDYTIFDLDILTHINSTFVILAQLGIGPAIGFSIEDDTTEWSAFLAPSTQLNLVKSYIYLKVRMAFDPPTTSFAIEAFNKQIEETEWRLNVDREVILHPATVEEEEVDV